MDSPVNFIVYSHQRSGTTFFCNDVLSSHNEVFCFDELYNQRGHQPTIDALRAKNLPSLFSLQAKIEGRLWGTGQRYIRYHKRFVEACRQSQGKRAVGFKLFHQHIPMVLLPEFLKQNNFRVVVLNRKNLSQCAVSMYLSRFYRRRSSIDLGEHSRFTVSPEWCARWIANTRYNFMEGLGKIEESGCATHHISYQDINTLGRVNEVFGFLGLSPLDNLPEKGLKKINTDSIYEKIENLAQLEKAICNDYNGHLRHTT
ncbi:MAG: sulfotransferase domain-containing protein [Chitinophagales bacterium]